MREAKKFTTLIVLGPIALLSLISSCTIPLLKPIASVIEEEAAPSWSPDGQHLAFQCYLEGPTEPVAESDLRHFTAEAADICIINISGQKRVRLTKGQGADTYPIWSPDSSVIAYMRRDGIYVVNSDGSSQRQLVVNKTQKGFGSLAWAPSGDYLLFTASLENSEEDIYLADVKTGNLTNLTLGNDRHDFAPSWILDGTRIVFLSSILDNPALKQVRSQMRVVNVDGRDEKVIYDKEIFYNSISVLNTEQIFFTTYDLAQDNREYLYKISLDEREPIEVFAANRWFHVSVSPNERYLVYDDNILRVLELETKKIVSEAPSLGHLFSPPSWSPDSQQIAVTDFSPDSSFYLENHIYIFEFQSNVVRPLIQR